jgi:hypothetical protein
MLLIGLGLVALSTGSAGSNRWYLGAISATEAYALGGAMLVLGIAACPEIEAFVSARAARLAAVLGWLSLPIYLVNAPAIGSAGSAAYLLAVEHELGAVGAGVAGVLASLAACAVLVPLVGRFDAWWLRLVNRAARARRAPAPDTAVLEAERPNVAAAA